MAYANNTFINKTRLPTKKKRWIISQRAPAHKLLAAVGKYFANFYFAESLRLTPRESSEFQSHATPVQDRSGCASFASLPRGHCTVRVIIVVDCCSMLSLRKRVEFYLLNFTACLIGTFFLDALSQELCKCSEELQVIITSTRLLYTCARLSN